MRYIDCIRRLADCVDRWPSNVVTMPCTLKYWSSKTNVQVPIECTGGPAHHNIVVVWRYCITQFGVRQITIQDSGREIKSNGSTLKRFTVEQLIGIIGEQEWWFSGPTKASYPITHNSNNILFMDAVANAWKSCNERASGKTEWNNTISFGF